MFAALAIAATIVLEKGFLTLALAFIVLAMGYVYHKRPLAGMRVPAVILMIIWGLRVAADPRIVGGDLGTTPIFNWLLYGWGLSAAAFVGACYFFQPLKRTPWLTAIEAITIAVVSATIAVLLTHAWDPDQVFTVINTLPESAFLVLTGGGVALGLLHLRKRWQTTAELSVNWGIDILGYGGMALAIITLVFT